MNNDKGFRIEITVKNNGMIGLYESLQKFVEFMLGILQSAGLEVQGGIFKQNEEEENDQETS